MNDSIDTNEGLASFYCQRINSWKTLVGRTSENQELKQISADYFHRLILTRILSAGVTNLFFESGSSIAILARMFRKFIKAHRGIELFPKLSVETNNILACLEFELFGSIPVTLYPPGPPEDKYGATFGSLQEMLPLPPPTKTSPATIFPAKAMEPMRKHFKERFSKNGVVFMSASGLELNPDGGFQGPHVGSYPNMLFKRILLEAGCPTVMFLDQTKIEHDAFREGTCYPVCDEVLPWARVCTAIPFALVIGANHFDMLKSSLDQLANMGLTFHKIDRNTIDGKGNAFGVVLSNSKFEERFPEHCGRNKASGR